MKVGFVAIVGRPNVGKSSLLNSILNYKVAITSDKPQTTRDQIKGIYNDEDSQIVFIDTPGIHKPKQTLGESLNDSAYKSLKDVELVLFLQPVNEDIGPGDKLIIERIGEKNRAAVVTKIDTSNEKEVVNKVNQLKKLGFKTVVATSTDIKESITSIISFIKEHLEEGPAYYDREQITDRSMRFMAKEAIRESAIDLTKHELPHSIGVVIEDFNEGDGTNGFQISASIYVERDSQKGILVGRNGSMIKKIGITARKSLSYAFDQNIRLDLKIKVKKNWTSDPAEIIKMGY